MKRWPKTLYLTPREWSVRGEAFAVDAEELASVVRALHAVGGKWAGASESQAVEVRLRRVLGDGSALYEGQNLAIVVRPSGDRRGVWKYAWEPWEDHGSP
jgi:uncharacterized protein with von Willebrand factor type A (vWA) domain